MPKEKGPARSVGPIPYCMAALQVVVEIVVAVGVDTEVAGVLIIDEPRRCDEAGRDVGDECYPVTVIPIKPVRHAFHPHPIGTLRRPDVVETNDEPERLGGICTDLEVRRCISTWSRTGRGYPEWRDAAVVGDASAGLDAEPEPFRQVGIHRSFGLLLEPEVAATSMDGELNRVIRPLFVPTDGRFGARIHERESRAPGRAPRTEGAVFETVVENGCDGERRRGDENDCENCGEQQIADLHD
ncbi:MAG: hypothetical protein QG633_32 [Patescibacteria group bacterium]|nr:hypothetical protein [Patescibacteria group bacterium]